MDAKKYTVATRPSLLAYTQTEQTVDLLRAKHPDCVFEIVKFSTHGDLVTDKPLTAFGGTGIFVKELENAICEGRADFAIHSLKDVPSIQPQGLCLASFPKREDPRDVVLTKGGIAFEDLQPDCTIGTGSPRRILQLKLLQRQANFVALRGNIDTRISKLQTDGYDAIVLAAAGLNRIGRPIPDQAFIAVDVCLPAIGQGVVAIECRSGDTETIEMLRSINDTDTEIAVVGERSFMKTIGGGCKFPLAAYATIDRGEIYLRVMLGDHHTMEIIRFEERAPIAQAEQLGIDLAHKIEKEATRLGIEIKQQDV